MMTPFRPAMESPVPPPSDAAPEVYERGRLRIDFAAYEVWLDGEPVHLSLRDFELLRFFVRSPNRVYDRMLILKLVWGHDTHVTPRTVDVHVRRLRMQIERDPAHPELIVTVRGVGYRFNDRVLAP
jgi:DNA-binding response OmpR family regulator